MIAYFIKVSFCWALFLGIYWAGMRRETFFQLNRAYLILTFLLGLIVPLLPMPSFGESAIPGNEGGLWLHPVVISDGMVAAQYTLEEIVIQPVSGMFSIGSLLMLLLYAGAIAMTLRLLAGIFYIIRMWKKGIKQKYEQFWLIHTSSVHSPFSFLQYIFISRKASYTEEEENQILRHEAAHLEEGHSWDILLLELSSLLFWWNPLLFLYRQALKEVHEYLADAAVLRHTNKKQYGHLLIRQSQSGQPVALANNFHSLLKNRITMMTRKRSNPKALFKYVAGLPVLLLAFIVLAGTNPEQPTTATTGEADEMPVFAGCEDEKTLEDRMACTKMKIAEFLSQNINYPKEAREAGESGKAFISFTVNTEGSISDLKLLKDPGYGMGKEAMRVIGNMPRWTPGLKNGKAVAVSLTIPVAFSLNDDKEDQAVAKEVDEMPRFPGSDCESLETNEEKQACSMKHMINFIVKNIQYPQEAHEEGLEGKVFVKFVVTEEGRIASPKIVKSLGGGCDEEVLRILQLMNEMEDAWIPARKDGKAVKTELALPFSFKLDGQKKGSELSAGQRASKGMLDLKQFQLYPNPNNGSFRLSFEAEKAPLSLTIIDGQGKEIWSQNFDSFEGRFDQMINLPKMPAGPAYLTLKQKGKVQVKNIVIK
jgi:TonB family protein